MTDYTELVKALRCKRDDCEGCDLAFFDKDEGWMCQYSAKDDDAAAAIEALDRLLDQNTQRCEALRKQLRDAHESYEKHLNELEAQLPKRGEWIVDGMYTYNLRELNGKAYEPVYRCSCCNRQMESYLRLDEPKMPEDADFPEYCPHCGAKMEVQDG